MSLCLLVAFTNDSSELRQSTSVDSSRMGVMGKFDCSPKLSFSFIFMTLAFVFIFKLLI